MPIDFDVNETERNEKKLKQNKIKRIEMDNSVRGMGCENVSKNEMMSLFG